MACCNALTQNSLQLSQSFHVKGYIMSWYTNAIFYQVYLRAFRDADGNGHGDFAGLREKAEYLKWLGIDCVWLMPIYPSPLKDDGYDIASFYGIQSNFGLLEDFRMTVDELQGLNS